MADAVNLSPMEASSDVGWTTIPEQELASWNDRLLLTDAPLYQYPYWNESFRQMHFSPQYLVYRANEGPGAYVCILTLGLPRLKIGLIHRGPVNLGSGLAVSSSALRHLYEWAKDAGYIFLRFTHFDSEYLEKISTLGYSERTESFPFYRDLSEELLIEQKEDDPQMLAGFQQVARQEIKKASQVGYELEVSDSPEGFQKVWPLFERLSKRKGFNYRPLVSYLNLIRLAQPHRCIRLYVASFDKQPIEAILILRDRTSSAYMSGALDLSALGGRPSPSSYLHWIAMRDLFRQGIKHYSLGTRSGAVYQFKRKFRPTERIRPQPVTLVLNARMYSLWSALVLRIGPSLWPYMKRMLFR